MPVFDPAHFELLYKEDWQVCDDFDAEVDPITYARDWLAGYAFRLEEAERYTRFTNATEEGFEEMLAWADDPTLDRRVEALSILLEQTKIQPNAPYSPGGLLLEFEWLFNIPVRSRLRDGFVDRMTAWLDRVESFLSTRART